MDHRKIHTKHQSSADPVIHPSLTRLVLAMRGREQMENFTQKETIELGNFPVAVGNHSEDITFILRNKKLRDIKLLAIIMYVMKDCPERVSALLSNYVRTYCGFVIIHAIEGKMPRVYTTLPYSVRLKYVRRISG